MFRERWHAMVGVLGLLLTLSASQSARAQTLSIEVVDPDAGSIQVFDNGALDSDQAPGVIAADVDLLNSMLVNFSFVSLRATSNSPAPGIRPLLSLSGKILRAADAGSRSTVTIRVSDVDFDYAGATWLRTSISETFENVSDGDRVACRSYLDPADVAFGESIRGTRVTVTPRPVNGATDIPTAASQNASPTRLNRLTVPYSMTSEVEVTLGKSGPANEPRSVQFSVATCVTKP